MDAFPGLETSEILPSTTQQQHSFIPNNPMTTDHHNINNTNNNTPLNTQVTDEILSTLNEAKMIGITSFPKISGQSITDYHIDPSILPNSIPQQPSLPIFSPTTHLISPSFISSSSNNNNEPIYDEIQIPLLLTIAYFIFQLPFLRQFLNHHLPFIFTIDGQYSIIGLIIVSILFGTIFHFLLKLQHFTIKL